MTAFYFLEAGFYIHIQEVLREIFSPVLGRDWDLPTLLLDKRKRKGAKKRDHFREICGNAQM